MDDRSWFPVAWPSRDVGFASMQCRECAKTNTWHARERRREARDIPPSSEKGIQRESPECPGVNPGGIRVVARGDAECSHAPSTVEQRRKRYHFECFAEGAFASCIAGGWTLCVEARGMLSALQRADQTPKTNKRKTAAVRYPVHKGKRFLGGSCRARSFLLLTCFRVCVLSEAP